MRLAPEDEKRRFVGHVAFFRGPGMVVKYWDRSGLAQGMRPFHAIVVAGLARDPQAPSEADKEVERFLRDAEPPGHDEWMSTAALKDAWKPGYAKALEQLKDRITRELRELLVPKPSHGSRGPERLQKRFPIGRRGTSKGSQARSALQISAPASTELDGKSREPSVQYGELSAHGRRSSRCENLATAA